MFYNFEKKQGFFSEWFLSVWEYWHAWTVEGDCEGHVDDVPLRSDHHLHHHHEEQRQELIDLKKYLINKDW